MFFAILIKIMKKKVAVLLVRPARRNACEAINDDLYLVFFCLCNHSLKALISSEHVIRGVSGSDCEWCCIRLLELILVHGLIEYGIVVTLQHTHQIQGSDSSAAVLLNRFLNL